MMSRAVARSMADCLHDDADCLLLARSLASALAASAVWGWLVGGCVTGAGRGAAEAAWVAHAAGAARTEWYYQHFEASSWSSSTSDE